MSNRAHIATKYQVCFCEIDNLSPDEMVKFINELKEKFPDGNVVTWHNENETAFELDREELQENIESFEDDDLKDFCQTIVDGSDQSIHYIRLEIF